MGETAEEQPTAVYRALADERRSRIVEELRGERHGIDAQTLASRLNVHPNTVRWHLGILVDAGLVAARRARSHTPGRPRTLYALCPDAAMPGRDESRLLASVLTTALASESGGSAKAESAGRVWGRYLAPKQPPFARTTREEATADAVRLLSDQGFAPEAVGDEIHLRRCPYLDLAEQHPDIVCSVHRGLLAAAIEDSAPGVRVVLEPFAEPNVCRVRLCATS
jgi:predicted ArsR family transcriptional regulator